MTRSWASVLALVGAALIASGCSAPPRPNVVVITIDTLRADHVGAYGYRRPTTPFFDRFAARGFLFEQDPDYADTLQKLAARFRTRR